MVSPRRNAHRSRGNRHDYRRSQLQFWSAGDVDDQGTVHRSFLQVDGNLFVQGSAERPVEFFPRSLNPGYPVKVRKENSGRVELHYVRILDPVFDGNTFPLDLIDHCYFTQSLFGFLANPDHLTWSTNPTVRANEIKDSIFRRIGYYDGGSERALYIMNQKLYGNLYDTSVVIARGASAASAPIRDNVFLKNYKQSGWVIGPL